MTQRINGTAVTCVAIGSILIWSGIKGWNVTQTVGQLITGKKPSGTEEYGLVSSDSANSSSTTSGVLPPRGSLGTTLPPQSTMDSLFGPINDASYEKTVPFAGKSVRVNKALANNVKQIGDELAAAGYSSYIRTVGGFRTSKGASGSPIPYSMHQYGAAIDINEDGGPNGNWNTMTLPAGMVSIFAKHGWFCGENWSGASRDGGHFQYSGG